VIVSELIERLHALPESAPVVVRLEGTARAVGADFDSVTYDRGIVEIGVDEEDLEPISARRRHGNLLILFHSRSVH
jgi:hypothetical protein